MDTLYHLHPQTNAATHMDVGPQVFTAGHGATLVDDTGREYLDAMAGLWSVSLGYSEDRLIDAACEQLRALPFVQTFAHRVSPPAAKLAAKLIELAPVPMSKAFFQCSGSEANDSAVKFAWLYHANLGAPERTKILTRQSAYHGTSVLAASLTGLPKMHEAFPLPLPLAVHLSAPHHYRNAKDAETEAAFYDRMIGELEQTIAREGAETIAAIFLEPVMGTGGVLVPPRGYLPRVAELARSHGILVVADEVICGFGRTGHWWGSDAFGLEPDMLTCAKGLSSSYQPIAATLINDKVFQVLHDDAAGVGVLNHGYTFGGHPVACAVALAAIEIYEKDGIIAQAAATGDLLQSELRKLADHPLVGEVRGIGMMAGVELSADKANRTPFDPKLGMGSAVSTALLERGVILRALGDTIVCAPPLIISETDVHRIAGTLSDALDVVHRTQV